MAEAIQRLLGFTCRVRHLALLDLFYAGDFSSRIAADCQLRPWPNGQSRMMTIKLFLLALASVSLSALAQIMLKTGVSDPKLAGAFASADRVAVILAVLASPYVIAGLSLYFLGALVWLVVLSQVEVSLAYPLVGLGFLLTAIFAALFLDESVSPMRLLGTVLVALGVYFVARS